MAVLDTFWGNVIFNVVALIELVGLILLTWVAFTVDLPVTANTSMLMKAAVVLIWISVAYKVFTLATHWIEVLQGYTGPYVPTIM